MKAPTKAELTANNLKLSQEASFLRSELDFFKAIHADLTRKYAKSVTLHARSRDAHKIALILIVALIPVRAWRDRLFAKVSAYAGR